MTPNEKELAAMEAHLYWTENLVPEGIGDQDSAWIWEFLLCAPFGLGADDSEKLDPAENHLLALLETLMAFDGFLPATPERGWLTRHRERSHRMASVEVADILGVTPTQLAGSLRQVDLPPRQMRLGWGRNTKGFERFDVERAWNRYFGDWMEELAELTQRPRAITIREAIVGTLTPATS